jgi:N-acetylneuraminic acid mutarotase
MGHDAEEGPSARMYAASAVLGDSLVMCGGWDGKGLFYDDVWVYDLVDETWKSTTSLPGGPASRHTMCALNDTHALVHTFRCEDHVLLFNGTTVRRQSTTGDAPGGYSMQAISRTSRGVVLVGGSTRLQEMSNDVFELDTTTWHWTKYPTDSDGPSPRASSAMCTTDRPDVFWVFGGAELRGPYDDGKGLTPLNDVWRLDMTRATPQWTHLESPTYVTPRVAAVLERIGTAAVLCGGWNPQTKAFLNDTWVMSHQ